MRPDILNPIFASATTLPGVGPKLIKTLGRLFSLPDAPGVEAKVVDLIWHLPSGVIDRSNQPPIMEAPEGQIVTIKVTVGRHKPPPRHNRRVPYKVECSDDSGSITLVFFNAHSDFLRRQLPDGEVRYISGKVEWFNDQPQMVHPDHMLSEEEFADMPMIEPVYPMTAGLSPKTFRRAAEVAVGSLPPLEEWQDAAWLQQKGWESFQACAVAGHAPQSELDITPESPIRARLAYDELLANQLALALVRRQMKRAKGRALRGTGTAREAVLASLPYSPTTSQAQAVSEVLADMASEDRMLRLLQGDVGSGKTLVALLALLTAVEAGAQGALMVPTEILARQHLASLTEMCAPAGVSVELLTGREKGKVREAILERLANGEIGILVGTHALFQAGVEFQDLGLAVIDEQHRFGVHQRLAIQSKAAGRADVLVMTATPIPRTLSLTHYGDMEVSRLTEKPAGRQPVDTRVLPSDRLSEVIDGVGRAIASGARVFWVCPLVEENPDMEWIAAEARHTSLNERFPGQVGLVHGRMKGPEKDQVMEDFVRGALSVLVATTVIEVGVDVPEATIMVIENAERFGLSQLHQLRGRVGRGSGKSTCLLLYSGPLGETAKARLKIMRETEDGFVIAEEDLRLRGAGEMLGTRQSGVPEFRLADLAVHGELLAAARDDTGLILSNDPTLTSPRGEALRTLLYLFERDEAIRLLSAG